MRQPTRMAERCRGRPGAAREPASAEASHGPADLPTLAARSMLLPELIAACQEETARRQRGEPFSDGFGFELFRRAVAERDAEAWEAVLAQYRGLVTSWVLRHPAYAPGRMDAQDIVVRAFGRLWMAIGPERLARFPGLGALLQYLKLCVHSVLLDEISTQRTPTELAAPEENLEREDIEALALDRLSASQLWEAVLGVLHDEAERTIVHLSFALGMQPGGIHERCPGRFASVADVYRIKRNIIDRLRRSEAVRAFLRPAGPGR